MCREMSGYPVFYCRLCTCRWLEYCVWREAAKLLATLAHSPVIGHGYPAYSSTCQCRCEINIDNRPIYYMPCKIQTKSLPAHWLPLETELVTTTVVTHLLILGGHNNHDTYYRCLPEPVKHSYLGLL